VLVVATWKAQARSRPRRKLSLSSDGNVSRSSLESGVSSKVLVPADNLGESSSSNSRADDESSKVGSTPVKNKKGNYFFKKRHQSSEKGSAKSKLLSLNRLVTILAFENIACSFFLRFAVDGFALHEGF
jgi:hypothetical protein